MDFEKDKVSPINNKINAFFGFFDFFGRYIWIIQNVNRDAIAFEILNCKRY
jgi:hypothetical protein